ncbi:MAG TPA: hypothetical protein VF806_10535 [Anaerolineaceae bacterium]
MRAPVATAFAIAFGLIVLLGYFIPTGATSPALVGLMYFRSLFIDWAVVLAAFAALVAILGLANTHWRKLRALRNPDRYSFFTLFFFALTLVFGIVVYFRFWGSPADFQNIVIYIQAPVEASLMAVLAVTLTFAAVRLFQRRRGLLPVVFIISVLAFLLLNSGLLAGAQNSLVSIALGVLQFLPVAGGRGILLGIALGSLMAGLRILFGADRPYSG